MTLYLHSVPLSNATQTRARGTATQDLVNQTALDTLPTAQVAGTQPGQIQLSGSFVGASAGELARALDELGNAVDDGLQTVPVWSDTDAEPVDDGYYTVSSAETTPPEPSEAGPLVEYTLSLERVGTRQSQWRAVATAPTALESDLATGERPTVAVPSTPRPTYWWSLATGRSQVDAVDTVTVAGGELEIYDPADAAAGGPELLYNVAYDDQFGVDCVLWDTYGHSTKTDVEGVVQWRAVYSRGHDPRGPLVASTRRFRLRADPDNRTLAAESYATDADAWSDVSLGSSSSWNLIELDIAQIDPAVIRLQTTFAHGDDDDVYTLDARLRRGADGAVWSIPQNERPPTPPGLVDLLEPTAADSYEVAGATTTTRARSETRQ